MRLITFSSIFTIKILTSFCKLNGEGVVCGRPLGANVAEEKIVGGYDVGFYKYPWYAALMVSDIVACGGVLVASKIIVSAAHCYKEYLTENNHRKLEDVYNVTLGIYNRCEKEKTQKMFSVQKVYVHEKYKSNIPYYDISLLILKENTNGFQPICLPKSVIKKRPKEGSVPGLGTLRYHGSTPCTLHEARLLIYSDSDCKKMINQTGNDPTKFKTAFCAGYLQGGIDTCQGDSGGPFQIIDDYGNHILLGVVSFGFHCANPNLLGIYTDVTQFVDWIEQKGNFKATIEGSHEENETTTTEKYVKTTRKAQVGHVIQETFERPLHIIIFKKGEERKSGKIKKAVDMKKRKVVKNKTRKNKNYKTKIRRNRFV